MKQVMEEMDDIKRELNENAPSAIKRKMESAKGGVKLKRIKVTEETPPRRSSRPRKVVSYVEESEGGASTNNGSRKAVSTSSHSSEELKSTRSLRPRKAVNYAEETEHYKTVHE